jgi:chromosome segregation ATPase
MFAIDQAKYAMLRRWVAACVMVSASLCSTVVMAQADKDGEQIKRLKLQLRQIQQQQQATQEAQGQADQARAKAEEGLKAQEGDLKRERANAGTASRKLAALSKELDAQKAENTRIAAELAAASEQLKALQATSRKAQESATATEADLRARRDQVAQQLGKCSANNAELALIGEDLLARYENKGITTVLSEREPFVQTSRVRLENFKAEYSRRIANERIKPAPADAAATAASPKS